MPWVSRAPEMQRALDLAIKDGLTAGAYHYANEVKKEARGGYTSGDFVTGATVAGVTVLPAERVADGWEAKVGTNLLYNLFWEIGHNNLFTGKYERVEIWRPVMVREAQRIQQRVWQVSAQRIQAMAP